VRLRWIRSHHAGDLDSVELCLGRRLEPGPKSKTRRAARREGWCRFARRASRASRRSPGGRGRSRLGASPRIRAGQLFSRDPTNERGPRPEDANAVDAVFRALARTRASTRAALAACRAAFELLVPSPSSSTTSSTTRRDVDDCPATAAGACAAAGLLGPALGELSGNPVFMSAFWAWLTAQLMKYVTTFYREGKWDWRVMFDSGGMPSSHSSLVVGLTTAIAYGYGLSSPLFPLALAFSLIVMYDAAGVRRHAGKQAEVLNRILEGMVKGDVSEKKLKEVLGHSPLQVFAGSFLGVLIGIMYMYRYSGGYGCLA
jgi:acid phosphatase family membrane protein YuiD